MRAPTWPGAPEVAANLEAACDLRIGQVGVATLKVRRLDLDGIGSELRAKVEAAPQLLQHAPVIVDLNAFPEPPDAAGVRRLFQVLRDAGVLPVGLTYGSGTIEALARGLDLPLFSRFRANYEHEGAGAPPPGPAAVAPPTAAAATPPAPDPGASAAAAGGGAVRVHEGHVRSGQQIYARGQDLTVVGSVGAGAEVIADGNIHIYGALRGRALAGAAGDTRARVFCREFGAELVAVAGHYRVLDDAPAQLHGRALHIRLDGERLLFEPLFVVTSGKGGVGKTTTSASIASGLALRGNKTAVIDFDVGLRNLDLIMGCERRVVYDFINVINGDANLNQALIKDKHCDNLFVLPASQTRDKDALTEEGVEKVSTN
jgi:septum site-determining protein MinC